MIEKKKVWRKKKVRHKNITENWKTNEVWQQNKQGMIEKNNWSMSEKTDEVYSMRNSWNMTE